jgi:hypothetical protein
MEVHMLPWWVFLYGLALEFAYKIHRLTLLEFGKLRLEFAPPEKKGKGSKRIALQPKQSRGKKQLYK